MADDDSPWAVAPRAPSPKFRVAICGGGIGGLCLAVALTRFPDVEVAVYEAAGSFKEVGAGVMIWGRTWRVMSLLGLDKVLREIAGVALDGSEDPPFGFDFRRADKGDNHRIHLLELPFITHLYHRAHFLDVFVDRLPKGTAHLGKRLRMYSQSSPSSPIELGFADGSTTTCDILVGADGVKSTVRRCMYEGLAKEGQPEMRKFIEPFWSGTVAYRALVPAEKLSGQGGKQHRALRQPTMYCGVNKHIVCYPIAKGKLVNFVGMASQPDREGTGWTSPWVSNVPAEEVFDCYRGWIPEAQELIKAVQNPLKWAIHQVHPLPKYAKERVALLGDAAHAMTPHQGAGAGQSIEDAYILAGILGHHSVTSKNLSEALQAYEYVRRPFANNIIETSRAAGAFYELRSAEKDQYTTLVPAIRNQWSWVESEDPEDQLGRALRWLANDRNVVKAVL